MYRVVSLESQNSAEDVLGCLMGNIVQDLLTTPSPFSLKINLLSTGGDVPLCLRLAVFEHFGESLSGFDSRMSCRDEMASGGVYDVFHSCVYSKEIQEMSLNPLASQ